MTKPLPDFSDLLGELKLTTSGVVALTGIEYMTIASWRAGHRQPNDANRELLSTKLKVSRRRLDAALKLTRKRHLAKA